jgi:hypothetical protein
MIVRAWSNLPQFDDRNWIATVRFISLDRAPIRAPLSHENRSFLDLTP